MLPRHGWSAAAVLLVAAVVAACSGDSNPLAPYDGERPLQILAVTQSFTPQIQWVGGRVAAIGVNRDTTAALDSTLVWMMTADDNTIGSFVTIGEGDDANLVSQYGGFPLDSLEDGETYTFWMAERDVLDAELDPASFNGVNFTDTTVTLDLLLTGRSWGGVDVEITIAREEKLAGTRYIVSWTPADVAFHQIGINRGRNPSFSDLVWQVVTPDAEDGSILPPVVIGEVPAGTDEAVGWAGFETVDTYFYWMTTAEWEGRFGRFDDGLAYFQILSSNFEEEGEE